MQRRGGYDILEAVEMYLKESVRGAEGAARRCACVHAPGARAQPCARSILERTHEDAHVVVHAVARAIEQSACASLLSHSQIKSRNVYGIDVHKSTLAAVPAQQRVT